MHHSVYKNSGFTSQRTQLTFITQTNLWMLCREISAVYFENHRST